MWDEDEGIEDPFKGKRWTGGRIPNRFSFTYEDISSLTRLSVGTIRQYVNQKKLDPKDLGSLVHFVAPYLGYRRGGE